MYKYEYVTIVSKKSFAKGIFQEHREIIDKYAQNGWRYVGFIPTKEIDVAYLAEMDLVFEKQEQ